MIQLDLFKLEIEPAPITSIPNYIAHDNDKFLSEGQIRVGLRTGKPPYPGYYLGITAHDPPIPNLHEINKYVSMRFTKFWNGFKWVYPEGLDVQNTYLVVWDSKGKVEQPILSLSSDRLGYADSEGFVKSSDMNPPFPGVFYATDSENKTLKYMRSFDGKNWSTRVMMKSQEGTRMYWNVRKIPTREDIIEYMKEYK